MLYGYGVDTDNEAIELAKNIFDKTIIPVNINEIAKYRRFIQLCIRLWEKLNIIKKSHGLLCIMTA